MLNHSDSDSSLIKTPLILFRFFLNKSKKLQEKLKIIITTTTKQQPPRSSQLVLCEVVSFDVGLLNYRNINFKHAHARSRARRKKRRAMSPKRKPKWHVGPAGDDI
jgi:hypothetical protein